MGSGWAGADNPSVDGMPYSDTSARGKDAASEMHLQIGTKATLSSAKGHVV